MNSKSDECFITEGNKITCNINQITRNYTISKFNRLVIVIINSSIRINQYLKESFHNTDLVLLKINLIL